MLRLRCLHKRLYFCSLKQLPSIITGVEYISCVLSCWTVYLVLLHVLSCWTVDLVLLHVLSCWTVDLELLHVLSQ